MHLLPVRVMDGRDDPLLNNKLFCVIQAVTGHFCKGQGNATVLKNCRSMIVYVCMCVCVGGGGGSGGCTCNYQLHAFWPDVLESKLFM